MVISNKIKQNMEDSNIIVKAVISINNGQQTILYNGILPIETFENVTDLLDPIFVETSEMPTIT